MFRRSILIVLIAVLSINTNAYSQRGAGRISGKILDSDTKSPLVRANVSLLDSKDSSVVTGAVTDSKGAFEIENVRGGSYITRINYVGYTPYVSDVIVINKDSREIDLKTIFLKQSSTTTDAVEVVAEKQMMEYSQGKKIFNVDKNIASAGGNAIDIIKNIPSVNVDVDGNISLRGSSNLRVLINGKPTSMSPQVLMETTPASSIESVEIITNPSAKYDAEGMTGIINLVLKQNKENGLNGIASVNFGTNDKYNFSLNTNYQINDWNIFANYDFGKRNMSATGESTRKSTFDSLATTMVQDINRSRTGMNHNVRTGVEYKISPLDQVTLTLSYRNSDGKRRSRVESNTTLLADNSLLDNSYRKSIEEDEGPSYDASLNYRHNFGTKGHDLTFDAFFSKEDEDEYNDYQQFYMNKINPSLEKSSYIDRNQNFVIQSDYVLPFGTDKLEAGFKFGQQKLDIDYSHFNQDSMGNWTNDVNKSNRFVYDEQIAAFYGIFNGKLSDLSYSIGLRGEYSMINTDLKTTGETNEKTYFDIFPSLSLSYKFSKNDELMVNYSRRINRPRSHSLNPFTDYSDPYTLRSGNPDLDPEYVNAYELSYLKNFSLFSVTPTLFYRKTMDKMTFITELVGQGVMKTTFENLAEGTNYGLELNISYDFVKWMRLSTDFSYYRSEIKGAKASLELENNDYSWTARMNANVFLSKSLSFQLIGNYMGPTVTAQGERYETYFMDLGARYDILDRRASITFRLSDIFDTMSFGGTAFGENFDTRYRMNRESRVAFLGFQYKINEGIKQREKRRQQENGGMDMEEF